MTKSKNIVKEQELHFTEGWEARGNDVYRLFLSSDTYIFMHVPTNKSLYVTAIIRRYSIDEKRPGNVKDGDEIVKVKFPNDPDIETVKRNAIHFLITENERLTKEHRRCHYQRPHLCAD